MPEVKIVALPDGPYLIEGDCTVVVTDRNGNPFPPRGDKTKRICLCRCGASRMKPWCDGSHKATGFQAAEVAPQAAPPPS